MNQQEWDKQFKNKYPGQPEIQDYMVEEIDFLKKSMKNRGITATDEQLNILWETYSESMDAGWISGSEIIMDKVLEKFLNNPEKWWDYPLNSN